MNNELRTKAILLGVELEDGQEIEEILDLNRQLPNGYFSLQLGVTGTGSIAVTGRVSNNGRDFVLFDDSAIAEAFAATSGPEEDGKALLSFQPPPARFLKLTITATGTPAVVAWYCNQ